MWKCIVKEECPHLNGKICGLNFGKPIFKSYHIERPQIQLEECYLQHVSLCYREWKEKKKAFINPIIKRMASLLPKSEEIVSGIIRDLVIDLEIGLKVAILHHDLGKLTKEYQEGEWYRHEIIGAHLVHNMLSEYIIDEKPYGRILRALLSAAVYLHHEAIQLAHGWLGFRSPTFEYLINSIGTLSFTFEEDAYSFFNYTNIIGELDMKYKLPKKVEGREIVNTIGNFVSLLDSMPRVNATRLCLASILLLVSEVDNRAAELGRSV